MGAVHPMEDGQNEGEDETWRSADEEKNRDVASS